MDSNDGAGQAPRSGLAGLLGSWRIAEPELLELRRVHAHALAEAVARRCLEGGRAGVSPEASADLLERASETTWAGPDVAFAHYVQLQREAPSDETVREIVASLLDACSRPAPPPAFRGDPAPREWKSYGLRTLVGDYRRDGRELELRLAEPSPTDVEQVEAAQQILTRTWPEMGRAIDALVREIVWFHRPPDGAPSGTVIQAYGAVFAACGQSVARLLEVLVHETTHLEVIARFALDKALVRPQDRDTSPFRRRPRPLSRVLHAAMVAARDVEAFDRSVDELPPSERDRAAAIRQGCAESLGRALASLERAEWTPLGASLFEDLKSYCDRIQPTAA